MAQFKLDGQTYRASRKEWQAKAQHYLTSDLENTLCTLGRLTVRRKHGELECSDWDWDELAGIADDISNELSFRHLFVECGITLEVR